MLAKGGTIAAGVVLSVVFAWTSCIGAVAAADPTRADVAVREGCKGLAPFAPTNNAFSAALRVKVEGRIDEQPRLRLLASVGNGFNHGFRMLLFPDYASKNYRPVLEIGVGPHDRAWALESKKAAVAPGRWCRLAATWDGKTARLWADGKEIAAAPYAGKFVPAGEKVFRTGVPGESFGVLSIPFVLQEASVWTRALSAEEVRAFAPGAPREPDTPAFAAALAQLAAGDVRPLREIDAWLAQGHAASVNLLLRRGRALALLDAKDADAAVKERDAVLAEMMQIPREVVFAADFRERFDERAVLAGFARLALADVKDDFRRMREMRSSALPYAALRLLKTAERAGDAALAAEAKQTLATCDLRGFPQLAAELGRPVDFTAHREPGAATSRAMPPTGFHVALNGDDAAPGTLARPFRTFRHARDAVRALKRKSGLPAGGVAVWVHGGTWRVEETLELGPEDSGETARPVVWSAWQDETPVLDGGVDFAFADGGAPTDPDALARLPREARAHVRVFDVRKGGFAHFEPLPNYGYYVGKDNRIEGVDFAVVDCYQDNALLTPARHPNVGWLTIDALGTPSNTCVKCDALGDLKKWTREPDLAATGFWDCFWADYTTAVTNVDPAAGTLAVKLGAIRLRAKQTFFLLNALCALDAPGEWFLDRAKGLLYVWPKDETAAAGRFALSSFGGTFLAVRGAHDLRVEGFTFQNGRGRAVRFDDVCDCVFAGNVVRGFGATGMAAHRCRNVTIAENVFRAFGHGALEVSGGNRKTLERAGCVVSNNDFADVENRRRTYAPHLHLAGVGIEASFNRFTDSPSSAMRLEGNDFFIVSNRVEDVLLESDDQGAVDIYYNASYFGNRYCFNLWKNVGRHSDTIPCGQAAIRFDGNISGQTVYGNRFVNCGTGNFGGVQSCGGRLHVVDNNLFVDCGRGMSINHYPTNYWFGPIRRSLLHPCLREVCITNAPFATHYPGIADLLWTNQVNHLVRNVTVGATPLLVNPPPETVACCNWHFPTTPDLERLARETIWQPIPAESDVGPRATPRFRRACAAAGLKIANGTVR